MSSTTPTSTLTKQLKALRFSRTNLRYSIRTSKGTDKAQATEALAYAEAKIAEITAEINRRRTAR